MFDTQQTYATPDQIASPVYENNSVACEMRPHADDASAAKAARAEFLQMVLKAGVTRRFEIINTAYASDMSDAEFRVLFGCMQYGNRDGGNISVGLARIGLITGKGESSVRRTMKALEASGWFSAEKQRQKAATRTGTIPPQAMAAILTEIVDRSLLSGQRIEVPPVCVPQHIDRSNTVDRSKVSGLEAPDLSGQEIKTAHFCTLRPLKSEHITKEDKPNAPEHAHTRTYAHTREDTSNPPSWAAAISPAEIAAQRDVFWAASGALKVSNEYAAELARDFPRAALTAGLAIVQSDIGEAKSRMSATEVKNRIIRRFGFIESDERGRDRRHQQRHPVARMDSHPVTSAGQAAGDWRDDARAEKARVDRVISEFFANREQMAAQAAGAST